MGDLSHLHRENNCSSLEGIEEKNMKITKQKTNKRRTTILDVKKLEGQIRLVKLRQNETNSKLGFSLRGGKLPVKFGLLKRGWSLFESAIDHLRFRLDVNRSIKWLLRDR